MDLQPKITLLSFIHHGAFRHVCHADSVKQLAARFKVGDFQLIFSTRVRPSPSQEKRPVYSENDLIY